VRPAMMKFSQKLRIMCYEALTVTSEEIFKFKTYSVIYQTVKSMQRTSALM